jgi:MIP family channel proteins
MDKQPISAVFRWLEHDQESDSPGTQTLLAQCVAEALGTFGLVFAGCGAIMIDASKGQITHVGIGLVFGLIITVMIYALGHISGAHFNPAVTLAFVLVRHFPRRRLLFYWAAQLVGAILASLCLYLLLGDVASLGTTLPSDGDAWQSFGMETLLTFFLMIVIMAMATDTRAVGQAAALAIGGTIMLEALFAGPISGASMNPARSLAPALISGTWTDQWVYVFGPFLGAIAGALVYHMLRKASSLSPAIQHKEKESTPIGKHVAALLRSNTKWASTKQMFNGEKRLETANKVISQNTGWSQSNSTTEPTPTIAYPMRVLFLSTRNSARSQMAEGLLRSYGGKAYQVFSAGTNPTSVHPLAIKAMGEVGIDISTYRAKQMEEFATEPPMDLVITVCDKAAQTCPSFPNTRWQIHWHFPDPSQITGGAEEQLAAFCHIRDSITARINLFPAQNPSRSSKQLDTEATDRQDYLARMV